MSRPILLFGEIHGTENVPALILSIIEFLVREHEDVVLLLEMPQDEKDLLSAILGESSEVWKEAFLRSHFWQKSYQYGQATEALLSLLLSLRSLKTRFSNISVHPISGYNNSSHETDYSTAIGRFETALFESFKTLLRVSKERNPWIICLTGMYHAKADFHVVGSERVSSFGQMVLDSCPNAVNILLSPQEGLSWCWIQDPERQNEEGEYGCVGAQPVFSVAPECKEYDVQKSSQLGWSLECNLGCVSPSPPAKFNSLDQHQEHVLASKVPPLLLTNMLIALRRLSSSLSR